MQKAWGLDCCWVCHRDLVMPLHLAKPRTLGLKRIHLTCFDEAVFKALKVEAVVLVTNRSLEEVLVANQYEVRRGNRQADLFKTSVGELDGKEEEESGQEGY